MNQCKNCGANVTLGASDCQKCGQVFGNVSELTPKEAVIFSGLGYFGRLIGWLFVGGFATLGPIGLMHGIERVVGSFVIYGSLITWAALPFTGLTALIIANKASRWILNINRLIWYAFLATLYIKLG
jgi:hypothetical protein